ncbi:MAG: excinuclease ABC subunit UvrC, partial [Candidatus Thermoplasmatota archaeon]
MGRPPSLDPLRERVARLPRLPGVYQWKDSAGAILYVGKANDLRDRVSTYLDPTTAKGDRLLQDLADVEVIAVRTAKEALLLEQTLIKLHRPRYNVRLTDDKQYPYLKLTNEDYPRLLKVHRRDNDGATYFGPFPDGTGAFFVAQAILELVPLRRCKTLPKQKCLYYDIGKCVAPCIGKATPDSYEVLVDEVKDLLSGRADHLVKRVQSLMEEAAAGHRFEDAARLRDQWHGLQSVMERQHMVHDKLEDRDVAALDARGELAAVVLLHQRDGKVVGQSPFTITGVGSGEEGLALADFLRGYYQDRTVPRYVMGDFPADVAQVLEADLRTLRDGACTIEAPQKGDKRRWLEVAQTNAKLRLEEEVHRRSKRSGAVEALQGALGLAGPPTIIEGFDISHLAGEHTRAALVRFVDGEPDKAGYRTFGMKTVGTRKGTDGRALAGVAPTPSADDAERADAATGRSAKSASSADRPSRPRREAGRDVDDYASIGEAVQRRYRGVLEREEQLPDLVLIDGGPGQLAAARASLQSLGLAHVALCSLAKDEELVHLPNRAFPVRLKRNDPALQLLQRVRDEAHRFGITQVQRKATQAVADSPLDDVPGIGPKRRVELVKAFGGLEGLRAASVDDLQRV